LIQLETPVALIIFNNPEATQRVFAAIAEVRPKRLFIIADAPRTSRNGEAELCEQTKRIATAVDWPCDVETDFASTNMGPGPRIISGINWVFSLVEEAIILEHDCLPDPSFFPFCAEMLERYRENTQIGYITGFNPLEEFFRFPFSYYFSQAGNLWGWATWRRSWREYDEHLSAWPEVKKAGLLSLLLPNKRAVAWWTRTFDAMHEGTGPSTWDYQFVYTCWMRNNLCILPGKNLIEYLGFGAHAENTKTPEPDLTMQASQIEFPLRHPPAITPWPAHAAEMQDRFFGRSLKHRIRRKVIMKMSRPAK